MDMTSLLACLVMHASILPRLLHFHAYFPHELKQSVGFNPCLNTQWHYVHSQSGMKFNVTRQFPYKSFIMEDEPAISVLFLVSVGLELVWVWVHSVVLVVLNLLSKNYVQSAPERNKKIRIRWKCENRLEYCAVMKENESYCLELKV